LQVRLFLVLCLGASCLFISSPATAEPIKIGAIFALSGKAKDSNKAAVFGVRLAIREINREGGLLGEKLELILLDNDSTPIGSYLAAQKAATAGVAGIIGAVWSSHSLAIAKVAEKHKIPMISPISTIPSLTAIGPHIFRVCYDDNFQGRVIAEFAINKLKARKALIFVDLTSDFSLTIADIFAHTFEPLGGQIVKEIDYKAGQSDYRPQVQQALAYDPDVIFFSGHDESGAIIDKLQQAGVHGIPIGCDGWDVDSFFALGGNKVKRGYFVNHWTPKQTDPLSQAFIRKYASEGEIKASTSLAYDAVHVLAAAIKKAGSTDNAAILRALHGLRGFAGVTGKISFDAQGNATKRACMMEIRDGVPHYLPYEAADE
jgi:branched-chain amino acid transport system substrate-binding protein